MHRVALNINVVFDRKDLIVGDHEIKRKHHASNLVLNYIITSRVCVGNLSDWKS